MPRIGPISDATKDPAAKAALDFVQQSWGMNWNITRGMANNPEILQGFIAFYGAIEQSGLSKEDREVICMEMARSNGCHYCVPAHRFVTKENGVDPALIERVAAGETLEGEGRPAQLQRLVRALLASKGALSDQDFESFQAAGITKAVMVAVVAEIAHCTFTNTFNRLAGTELDPFLEAYLEPSV